MVSEAVFAESVLLKEADIVSVTVFNEETLSGVFTIGPEGNLVLPLLGGIPAIGRSADELAGEVESLLESKYIRDAQVVVALSKASELPPQLITVIGQVAAPGRVPFEAGESMDLFTAVASAGGLVERSNRYNLELKRREGDDLKTYRLSIDSDRNFSLRDGDTVIVHAMEEVEERVETITVIGEVKDPGAIQINPDEPFDLITAIAVAGGFTTIARPTKVVVRRRDGESVKTFELNVLKMQKDQSAPFFLLPNDTVFVPESIF
ncbi:MAG: polysaccharide biosynthesis/export family protein [Verrucomicrobiales bacterium]|nr:polysaccharide biosynthesis/export family protein [Verrucomicrobiales bacterium]